MVGKPHDQLMRNIRTYIIWTLQKCRVRISEKIFKIYGVISLIKHYYSSKEVKDLLGCGSLRTAQLRIQAMNDELKAKGYWIERGKVPKAFFHEKYPYIPKK